MNYAGITEVCNWLHCFTHSLERLSPFYCSFHNICFCPLLLALHTFNLHCSVFKVLTSNLFQGQIETSVFQVLQSNLESLWKFSLLTLFFKKE